MGTSSISWRKYLPEVRLSIRYIVVFGANVSCSEGLIFGFEHDVVLPVLPESLQMSDAVTPRCEGLTVHSILRPPPKARLRSKAKQSPCMHMRMPLGERVRASHPSCRLLHKRWSLLGITNTLHEVGNGRADFFSNLVVRAVYGVRFQARTHARR